jgi:GTP cyclohydrolase FolE2
MHDEKRFMQDVGMSDLPFPMKVLSRDHADGQFTVAKISITARVMNEFEAHWIDRFVQVLHQHQDRIGTETLKANILDYMQALNATKVKVDFEFPFFLTTRTPVSKERCLVQYLCTYSASVSKSTPVPKVYLNVKVPCVTTFPTSEVDQPGGLFGQMSMVEIEVEAQKDVYPETLITIANAHSVAPVYSFLTNEDQHYLIEKIHSEHKTSVVMVDEIKAELANTPDIEGYSVTSTNFGMFHSYKTFLGTSKSMWIPLS